MANTPDLWRDMDRGFSGFGSWRPLLRQLDDFFNDAMDNRFFDDSMRSMTPQCDVEETDDHYLLSFDMPGLNRENIDIELQGNSLLVSGERKQETEQGEGRSRFVERRYGRFQRTIALPQDIKADAVEADYVNGVLKVAVPKSSESKRQKIKIGSGTSGVFSRLASKITGHDENKTVDVKTGNAAHSKEKH